MSVPKSGSIICDKAFNTSASAVPLDMAEVLAEADLGVIELKTERLYEIHVGFWCL